MSDDILEKNSESTYRALLGPLPCLFGLHGWRKPRPSTSISAHAKRNDDGTYDVDWDDAQTKEVTQSCNHCNRVRTRPDLDWDDVKEAWYDE